MIKTIYLGNIKGDKGDKGDPGTNGTNGKNATINGMNAITITDGNGINLSQSGSTFEISSDADSTPTKNSTKPVTSGGVYTALTNKANTSSVPTKTSQLTNDSGFVTSVPTKTSQLTNDSGFVTANDKVAKAGLAENIPVNPTSTTGLNIWIDTT